MARRGKIKTNNVILRRHEWETIKFLVLQGYNIEIIPKSNIEGVHTADILVDGVPWELKSPKGKGDSLMQNTLRKAAKQSANVVVDLRRVKRNQQKCIRELRYQFSKIPQIKRLIIITKGQKMLDISR